MHVYIAVFRCGVRWRHSNPPNSGSRFWSIFASLRKDSVTNYASIWTLFSLAVRGFGVLYNAVGKTVRAYMYGNSPEKLGPRVPPFKLESLKVVESDTDRSGSLLI